MKTEQDYIDEEAAVHQFLINQSYKLDFIRTVTHPARLDAWAARQARQDEQDVLESVSLAREVRAKILARCAKDNLTK